MRARARGPVVACRAAALCALLLLAGCKTELFLSMPEAEANDVVSILMQAGIPVSKAAAKDGTDTVLVEQGDFARAVALLRQHGLPRSRFQSLGDVFQQSGLVASPTQERARFLWALSQELSSTISQIDGVLTARVQVVLPDNDLLRREPAPSSASVFIRYDQASAAGKLVPQIKMLVASSVEGLSYEKVSVVLVPVEAQPLPDAPPPAAPYGLLALPLAAGALAAAGLGGFLARRRIAAWVWPRALEAAE